jgi:HEAT repeat protein
MKIQTHQHESLNKLALHALCDRLLGDDSEAVEECIAFLEAETRRIWHGRARAMMARRLKHCRLSPPQSARVVRAILDRLVSGRFSEQFKDQLRLVLHIAPESAFTVARGCQGAETQHVRRYAAWILSHETHHRRT